MSAAVKRCSASSKGLASSHLSPTASRPSSSARGPGSLIHSLVHPFVHSRYFLRAGPRPGSELRLSESQPDCGDPPSSPVRPVSSQPGRGGFATETSSLPTADARRPRGPRAASPFSGFLPPGPSSPPWRSLWSTWRAELIGFLLNENLLGLHGWPPWVDGAGGGLERPGQEGQVRHLLDLLPPLLLLAWALLLPLSGCWAHTGWSIKGHFTPQFWPGLAHPLFQVDKTTCGSRRNGASLAWPLPRALQNAE